MMIKNGMYNISEFNLPIEIECTKCLHKLSLNKMYEYKHCWCVPSIKIHFTMLYLYIENKNSTSLNLKSGFKNEQKILK
jgi:hypothetical protein